MTNDVWDRPTLGSRKHPRVLVFHPGKQHSYEAALASAKAGVLGAFITSVYFGAGPFQPRLYEWLPIAQRSRLDSWLRRRSHPDLPTRLVQSNPWMHLAEYLFRKLLPWSSHRRHADILFDWFVSRGLAKYDCSVVHGFEGSCPLTLQAAKESGAVAVLDVPSAHEYLIKVAREEGEKLDERWQRFEESVVRRERLAADFLLVASDFAGTCLLENGVPLRKLVKIPYGVDANRFAGTPPGGKHDQFRVLYVGKINSRKGIRYLLESWKELALPRAELVLVGPADDYGRRLLDEHRGRFRWLGNLSHSEVHRCFQGADLFVCPSLAEGSALVTYEAMATGLPSVLTPECGSVLRHGDDGLLVPRRDPRELAEAILWMYDHEPERRAMGQRARLRILKGYTWGHYHQRLLCAYQAMLAGRSPSEAISERESSWAKRDRENVKR